jgi:hypothetical protein
MSASAYTETHGWLTASEVARTLRVDARTVRSHADQLGGVRVGRSLRFPPDFAAPTFNTSARAQRPPEAPNRPTNGRLR